MSRYRAKGFGITGWSLMVAGALAGAPSAALAQDSTAVASPALPALGCADAEKDVEARHQSWGYGIAGALTGPIGVGYAAMRSPKPSASRLEFAGSGIEEYTLCYRNKARKQNIRSAVNGFAVGAMAVLIATFYLDSQTEP